MAQRKRTALIIAVDFSAIKSSFIVAEFLNAIGYHVKYFTTPLYVNHIIAHGYECSSKFAIFVDPGLQNLGPHRFWQTLQNLEEASLQVDLAIIDSSLSGFEIPFLKHGVHTWVLGSNICGNRVLDHAFTLSAPQQHWSSRMLESVRAWTKSFLCASWWFTWRNGWAPNFWMQVNPLITKRYGGYWYTDEYGPRILSRQLVPGSGSFEFFDSYVPHKVYLPGICKIPRELGSDSFTLTNSSLPIVYCSLGTYSWWNTKFARQFLCTAIEAAKMSDTELWLIQSGHKLPTTELPPNVQIVQFIPQAYVLQLASVFVSHCGFGSVREALSVGVPIVGMPFANDGFGNAAHIQFHQLGMLAELTPLKLKNQIQAILQNAKFKKNLKQFQHSFVS